MFALLAILLAVVGLNLWGPDGEAPKGDAEWTDAWPGLRPSTVQQVALSGGAGAVNLTRAPGGWILSGKVEGIADTRRAEQLVEAVARLSVGQPLEAAELSAFGLEDPRRGGRGRRRE